MYTLVEVEVKVEEYKLTTVMVNEGIIGGKWCRGGRGGGGGGGAPINFTTWVSLDLIKAFLKTFRE